MNRIRALALVVALGFVFGPALLYATGQRPQSVENRPLAAAPDLAKGWNALDELSGWASDHVVGRKEAIRTNSWIDYYVFGEFPGGTATDSLGPAVAGRRTAVQDIAAAPVIGRNGYLFLNLDFDYACQFGYQFRAGLRSQSRIADLLEQAGKKVVLVVAPDKTSVARDELRSVVPTGACAQRSMAEQRRLLAAYDDPRYLNLSAPLDAAQRAGRTPYWKTDSHWNSSGAAIYARLLADRLDPRVGSSLQYRQSTIDRVGDLMTLGGLDFTERGPAEQVIGRTVTEGRGVRFSEFADRPGTNRWTTTSTEPTVPGRTLIIGDSFSYNALGVVRPLFAQGTFVWLGYSRADVIEREIRRADTVIVELAQRSVVGKGLASSSYRGLVVRGTRLR